MTQKRIAELLAPFLGEASLSVAQLGAIERYLELLLKWNSKMNLTAVRDPESIVTRHFGESFFAAQKLFPANDSGSPATANSADVGSGAGFPGIPLKIWQPSLQLTLIESNQRKAVFLKEVVRAVGLSEVRVLAERAEGAAEAYPWQFDLVSFRAVEHFEQTLAVARRLVKPGGRVALLIGASQEDRAKSAADIRWNQPLPIPESSSRILLVGEALA